MTAWNCVRARHKARRQLPRRTYKRIQLKKRKTKKEGEKRSKKKFQILKIEEGIRVAKPQKRKLKEMVADT